MRSDRGPFGTRLAASEGRFRRAGGRSRLRRRSNRVHAVCMAVRDCYVSMGCHVSISYQLNTLVLLHEQPKSRQAQHCSRTCDV